MENPIKVSVVIPCYNSAATLQQCLSSIREQTEEGLEIICINDGSGDNTLDILQSNAAADRRVKIIDKANAGYGAACNDGIAVAGGEWVSIIEPDDYVEIGMYLAMEVFYVVSGEDKNGRIDIIKTPYWRVVHSDDGKQRLLHCAYHRNVKPTQQPFSIAEGAELIMDHPSIWSAIYRREFLNEYDIRFDEFAGAGWADNNFLIRTFCQAQNILYFDEPFYCYREDTPEQLELFTSQNALLPIDRWLQMLDIIEELEISDPRILTAHYIRGFYYVSQVIEVVPLSDELVCSAVTALFERMDAELVLADTRISPARKQLFVKLRGLPEQEFDTKEYNRHLLKAGMRDLSNIGAKNTFLRVKDFLSRKDARAGKE
jgi:glycosyltransferase involved in cell wall biosynthesis